MKRIGREKVYNVNSALNPPSGKVEPGETFVVETEVGRGEQCIEVEGSRAGSVLSVDILDVQPEEAGYTASGASVKSFPDWIRYKGWGQIRRDVKIKGGKIEWIEGFSFPSRPMIGMIGTAPKPPEAPSTGLPGIFGGNMDCPEVTAGSTIHLPVFVDGAFLHVGDVHAVQGDGEICGAGGIECRAEVTLRVNIGEKPRGFSWPRLETADGIATVGTGGSIDAAYRIAVEALLRWLEAESGWPEEEVFMLLGSVLEARICQVVNPYTTVIALFPQKVLEAMKGAKP